jgi:predicted transcriptional regulator
MIMNDAEVQERLESPNNLVNRMVEIRKINPDRGKRGDAVPEKVRELIGTLANESDETQDEIAKSFGVTQALVSQTSRGMVDSRLNSKLALATRNSKKEKEESAHDLALDAMVSSLSGITPEKVATIDDPIKLARLAESMSRISSNIKGKNEDSGTKVAVQVVLFSPTKQKDEDEYETVNG